MSFQEFQIGFLDKFTELESSLISFRGSDSPSPFNLTGRVRKKEKMARGVGAIISEIFPSKEGDYSRESLNRGTAIIRGNTVIPLCNPVLAKT